MLFSLVRQAEGRERSYISEVTVKPKTSGAELVMPGIYGVRREHAGRSLRAQPAEGGGMHPYLVEQIHYQHPPRHETFHLNQTVTS